MSIQLVRGQSELGAVGDIFLKSNIGSCNGQDSQVSISELGLRMATGLSHVTNSLFPTEPGRSHPEKWNVGVFPNVT